MWKKIVSLALLHCSTLYCAHSGFVNLDWLRLCKIDPPRPPSLFENGRPRSAALLRFCFVSLSPNSQNLSGRSILAHYFTAEQVINYHNGTCHQTEDLDAYITAGFFDGVETVLDVGCGDGQVMARLAKQFPKVQFVGCDISEEMIAFAKKSYPPSEYPNLTFLINDASHLGYDKEFDRVISSVLRRKPGR